MLNLVQTEFLKLASQENDLVYAAGCVYHAVFLFVYYNYFEASGIDPVAFYKLAAFGYTPFIILPLCWAYFVLC